MSKSYDWGREAERIAAEYLVKHGLPIREANWRPSTKTQLEVDIITQEGDSIVFVEVKARSHHEEDPAEAIDNRKIRNIVRAADSYLQRLDKLWSYRFDVILITGNKDNYTLEHIREAFMPPINTVY